MAFIFSTIAGGVCGLAAAGAWWALATLFGFAAPTDPQGFACVVLGAIVGAALGVIAWVKWG